ncbi:MAG TPA: asparagine synthase C-terminal domain-containing protein, partial [bacterium]|nr:asparagine synthase C-terminal domain-containing protein [bacterium]
VTVPGCCSERTAATPFRSSEEFYQLFSEAVALRLRSDVPVGVCLSGGLDSSSIVSVLLQDHQKNDLHTFSAVYGKGQSSDETEYILQYSAALKNMHFTTPDALTLYNDLNRFVTAHGEPIPSTAPYAQFKVMELARGNVVVTLDGQGVDEMLAGYHYFFGYYFKDLLQHGHLPRLITEIGHYLIKHRSLFGMQTFAYFLLPVKWRTRTRVSEKGYLSPGFANAFS